MKLGHMMLLETLSYTPMKQRDIRDELALKGYEVTERQIRTLIKEVNEHFIKGEIDFVIISNNEGCFKSINEADIHKYNKAKKSHALSELYMSYQVNKRIAKNKNMSFEDFLKEEE